MKSINENLRQQWEMPKHDFWEKKQIIKDNFEETLSPEDDIDDVTREVHENDSDD